MAPKPTYQHFATEDDKFVVYDVFKKAKKTVYHVRGGQSSYIDQIVLDGFEGLPAGLYLNRKGYGFGRKGVFLLSAVKDNLSYGKKIELIISNRKRKAVVRKPSVTTVVLTIEDVKSLLGKLGRINEDCNAELREAVGSFLTSKFPKHVNIAPGTFDEYQGGDIAASLRRKNVVKKMTDEDFAALRSFFPKLIGESLKGRKKSVQAQRLGLLKDTRKVADRIYLDEVIEEFERYLSKKTLSENSWQKFLKDKVFPFLAGYGTTIEKENVSISVSYPDFVMADVYGFIDVFEIKRHDTLLLSYDDSHENYYWKPEVSQAISQIENYIDEVIHNSDDFIKKIRRKKGVDIKVVRPRGYIIAGTSKQLKAEKAFEDYRKLGSALKNTSFILYDELLENLKNLRTKLLIK